MWWFHVIIIIMAHCDSCTRYVVLSDLAWLLNRLLGTRCCCRIEESFTLNTRQWLLIVVMDSLVTSLVFWPKCLLPCWLVIVAVIQSNDADGCCKVKLGIITSCNWTAVEGAFS